MQADDSSGSDGVDIFSSNPFVRWNLARGGLSPLLVGSPWTSANGGTPSWVPPAPPAQAAAKRVRAAGEKPLALVLGGSGAQPTDSARKRVPAQGSLRTSAGMFGPSLIPRIEGDFSLRITDVIDRPDIRDEAQVMRWETKNSESTGAPSQLAYS